MKRFLLLAPAAVLLASCGSSPIVPPPQLASQPRMLYVSSQHAPEDIASCLDGRLSRVRKSTEDGVTMLSIGSHSKSAYYIWLTPSAQGTTVKVMHPEGNSDDPPETDVRFAIARCVA